MAAKLEPAKAFPCTYPDCDVSYDTLKDMKRHKKSCKDHDYCRRCDEDFYSYDEYVLHKAYRVDNHANACRVCGDEFKTVSGMKRHVDLSHRVEQTVVCIGCQKLFLRASLLIEHLEFGQCPVISSTEFQGHLVHKRLVDEMMRNDQERQKLEIKTGWTLAALDTQQGGGVNLMDDELPEAATDFRAPQHMAEKAWPALPSQKKRDAEEEKELVAQLGGVSLADSGLDEADAGAWKKEGMDQTLFSEVPNKAAKLVPQVDAEPEHVNILSRRFWDPTSEDYKPERFLQPKTNTYSCPFACDASFEAVPELNRHIMVLHRIVQLRCPRCLNLFKTATALISHCENPAGRCSISKADDFNQALDVLSGGFLGVKALVRPDFLDLKPVMVRNECGDLEPFFPTRVSYNRYEGIAPPQFHSGED